MNKFMGICEKCNENKWLALKKEIIICKDCWDKNK